MSMFRASVVVVNFKQLNYINDFLDSLDTLFGGAVSRFQVVIVDNSGEIDINDLNQADILEITILKKGNIGYLKGLGLGMKHGLQSNPDFFVLCNPDVVFESALTIQDCESVIHNGVVAPYVQDLSGAAQNPNRRSKMSVSEQRIWAFMATSYTAYSVITWLKSWVKRFVGIARYRQNRLVTTPESSEIFLPHGSCMFVGRWLVENADFFDEDIFLWGEEAVIAGKCRENGGKVWFEPSIRVKHISHTSTGLISERNKYKIWRQSFKVYRRYLNK